MSYGRSVLAIALVFALAPTAFAAEAPEDPCAPEPPACRVEVIPASCTWVEREVQVPAVTRRVCTPVYETVEVPVYERKCTPRFEEVQVPVYAWRDVPVYRTVKKPVYGEKQVPIYREVKTPVTITVWNPFCCECEEIELYERCEKVQVGCETVPAIVGYRDEQVQCGTRKERYVSGHTTRQVRVGNDVEVVQTGVREERRLTGYKTEMVEVRPASTRVVRERVVIPCRRVTVVAETAETTAALPGTTEVLTEAEFQTVLAAR
ncbi:MAG: hypothetical protein QNJ98_14460 [Planctomycetota bacterium]|nr:hypothetical protein [Planctomycetota bacterium]